MIGSFVLKRIGKCSDGKNDTMDLKSVVTRIGRHSMNTYVMDSTDFPCLISRWHSAIIREESNGIVQYFVFDCKSVNGTFVNNVKIPQEKNMLLNEGDIVTFGCRGGNNISVGGRTAEEFAEFRFMGHRKSFKMNFYDAFTRNSGPGSAQEKLTRNSHKTSNLASFKGHPNGAIKMESLVVQPLLTSSLTGDVHQSSPRQHIREQGNNVAAFCSDNSQPSKVQCQPLKNALNNSTGHLTLHSEQKQPITGSQKRKSNRRSMPSSHTSENGSAPKSRKVTDNKVNVDEATAKQQKTRKKTGKAVIDNEDELCSAFNCLKPRSATLSWVQCDDCDEWFHVDCIKTIKEDYNIEKLEDSEFHCGCV